MTLTRKSITEVAKCPNELDKLIHAFRKIQDADPGEPGNPNLKSFYVIAGLHGQPFRGAGYANSAWWGGYCHHGNVLFPTWHRAYLFHLERALQAVPGCQEVTLPYWNEMEDKLPEIFLRPKYKFTDTEKYGDKPIDNPLHSYTLKQGFFDKLARYVKSESSEEPKLQDYGKYTGYRTVRCPYSGLVGKDDLKETIQHNWMVDAMGTGYADKILNENIKRWLYNGVKPSRDPWGSHFVGARKDYQRSLDAPNYTVFSNVTSAGRWNDDNISHVSSPDYRPQNLNKYVSPLERPHNSMHLAVGGHDFPDLKEDEVRFQAANGDMGENDSAGFDPIFFFHHCFVDKVFWSWQEHNRKKIEVIPDYPGTSSVDSQGPTPKMVADSGLDENTPLYPFKEDPVENYGRYLTSVVSNSKRKILSVTLRTLTRACNDQDVASTRRLGYTYDSLVPKLLDIEPTPIVKTSVTGDTVEAIVPNQRPFVRVSGIDRSTVQGSFAIGVWATDPASNEKKLVGVEPVFSRWHVAGCTNCQNTLHVTAHIPIPTELTERVRGPAATQPDLDKAKSLQYDIKLLTSRQDSIGKQQRSVGGEDGDNSFQKPRLDVGVLAL